MQYVTDVKKYGVKNVCTYNVNDIFTNDQLLALYPNGIGSESLLPDSSTGRVPVAAIQQYVTKSANLKSRPVLSVATSGSNLTETDMDKLVVNDADLTNQLRLEYCFYEQRYRYALKQFLTKATSRNQSDNSPAQVMLGITKTLNLRLNSILEIMNYMAQDRVNQVNTNKTSINSINQSINAKMAKLSSTYALLNEENAIVQTQKEMVRYTEEKNNYTSNQIAIWATLNIIALGSIAYVYRN